VTSVKGAVVIVVKELVFSHIGEKNIRPAVIVVVADGHAHPIALSHYAGLLSDVGESAVTVVVIEAVPVSGRLLLQRGDGRAHSRSRHRDSHRCRSRIARRPPTMVSGWFLIRRGRAVGCEEGSPFFWAISSKRIVLSSAAGSTCAEHNQTAQEYSLHFPGLSLPSKGSTWPAVGLWARVISVLRSRSCEASLSSGNKIQPFADSF